MEDEFQVSPAGNSFQSSHTYTQIDFDPSGFDIYNETVEQRAAFWETMRPWFQKRGYTLYRMKYRPEGNPPVQVPFCYVPSHEPVNEVRFPLCALRERHLASQRLSSLCFSTS